MPDVNRVQKEPNKKFLQSNLIMIVLTIDAITPEMNAYKKSYRHFASSSFCNKTLSIPRILISPYRRGIEQLSIQISQLHEIKIRPGAERVSPAHLTLSVTILAVAVIRVESYRPDA